MFTRVLAIVESVDKVGLSFYVYSIKNICDISFHESGSKEIFRCLADSPPPGRSANNNCNMHGTVTPSDNYVKSKSTTFVSVHRLTGCGYCE